MYMFMEEKYERELYPTYFLLVTGFSFLLFSLFSSLVDGYNVSLFWWIGGSTFFAGSLTCMFTLLYRARRKNRLKIASDKNHETQYLELNPTLKTYRSMKAV